MITKLFMLGPVVSAAGQIYQNTDYSPDPGIETISQHSDGQVDPTYVAAILQSPKINFSSTAIKAVLDIAGLDGYEIAGNFDFYLQKLKAGGARAGGTTSVRVRATKGLLTAMSISAEDKAFAKVAMQAVFVSADGTTSPIAVISNATMPTITQADQAFTIGPVKINGTEVEGVKSINIDFGYDLIIEHGSGEPYPTFVAIKTRKPMITIRTTDPTTPNITDFFAAQGSTDSLIYLWKIDQNGLRKTKATAEHLKFTIDDGMIHAKTIGGGGTEDVQMHEITIEPTWDGTNDVIAINTAVAIT